MALRARKVRALAVAAVSPLSLRGIGASCYAERALSSAETDLRSATARCQAIPTTTYAAVPITAAVNRSSKLVNDPFGVQYVNSTMTAASYRVRSPRR